MDLVDRPGPRGGRSGGIRDWSCSARACSCFSSPTRQSCRWPARHWYASRARARRSPSRRWSLFRSSLSSRRLRGFGFAALLLRAFGFTVVDDPRLLAGIQALDGISAAVLGVLTALIVADITGGTGRFNLTQGIVGTASGIGATISTTLSGIVAEALGPGAGYSFVTAVALLATLVVLFFMPETRPQTKRATQRAAG